MKNYTDIDQSKELGKILPIVSADMWYSHYGHPGYNPVIAYNGEQWFLCQIRNSYHDDIPCWSLAALIELLPPIDNLKPMIDLEGNSIYYSGNNTPCTNGDTLIDACYQMILKLKELNILYV